MLENLPPPIDEIRPEDWEKTPESVKRLVTNWLEQMGQIRQLVERIEQLERQYEEVKAENQLLKERVKQNSKNSSKPPSQDLGKGFKVKQKRQGKQNPGAQPGHEGHERPFYSVEQCQSVEDHYPSECIYCGEPLGGEDHEPYRIQSVEIPKVVPEVREHRFHALRCQRCGGYTRAWDETIINRSGYGERVVAHVGGLSGQYRQSHRMVQELLDELFGVKISVGSINQLRQESCQALAQVVEEAHQYGQRQSHVNMDETSFAQGNGDGKNPNGRKGWLWVMVTPFVSDFAVFLRRSQEVCGHLLGETFHGIISSDRFSAYHPLNLEQHQICWAHLKRDFTRIAERSGVARELGKALLEQQNVVHP
jgi:hypothetical protein